MKRFVFVLPALVVFALAQITPCAASTQVPGHALHSDQDENGFPDAGVYVNGHYTSVYAYDASGDFYWDLGDGRIISSVPTMADLDQSTLTLCNYNITYRADFNNDPYMDRGWIRQNIVCRGYDYPAGPAVFVYLIVHQSDPRYTGDPAWAVWGSWEYFVSVESGSGNLPRAARSGIGG